MKIRIKKTKQIKEMSGVGAVAGYAGGFKKKEELQEDGEFAAVTIGASRSIGNKNIREPYYDEEEPIHDDEKIKLGAEERNDHGEFHDRARNPRPTLHSFEEDLDESMMTLLATASEPEPGSGHTAWGWRI